MVWKHRYTALTIVFLVWLMSFLDRTVMSIAIPYIAEEFHLEQAAMGVVMSAFFFGYVIMQIPGGMLADKFGSRKLVTIAILWWSAFTAITGLAGSLAALITIRIIFGFGESVAPAATWRSLAVWTPVKKLSFANAVMMASMPLGAAIAPLFVVSLMSMWSWHAVFACLFVPGVLLALLVWKKLIDNPADKKGISEEELAELARETTDPGKDKRKAESNFSFLEVVKQGVVLKSFFVLFFCNAAAWAFNAWLPSYLVQAKGFSMMDMGVFVTFPYLVQILGFVVSGWVSDHFFSNNRKIPLVIFGCLFAVCVYFTFTSDSIHMLFIFQTLAGFFLASNSSAAFGLPVSTVPKEISGRAMGIVNTGAQIGSFLAPMVSGFLIQMGGGGVQGYNNAFLFMIVSMLMGLLVAMTIKQQQQKTSDIA